MFDLETFSNVNTEDEAVDLVYKTLEKSDGTVDDICKELFFVGEGEGEEADKIKEDLDRISFNEESYKGHKVHVTRIGGDPYSVELWSIEREERFLKAMFGDEGGSIKQAIMVALFKLEKKGVWPKTYRQIPYGAQAVYGIR